MTARPYYRIEAGLYKPGDEIPAGHWGRLVLGWGSEHQAFFRELAFERVRESEFPDRISRIKAGFVFESGEFAQSWPRADHEFLYLVEVPDATRTDRLDMSWLEAIKSYRSFDGAETAIRNYWRGDVRDPNQIEVLVEAPVIVRDRLTPIPENGVHK